MNVSINRLLVSALVFLVSPAPVHTLDRFLTNTPRLSYRGYAVNVSLNRAQWRSTTTIKKHGRVLAKLSVEHLGLEQATQIGLVQLFAGKTKQLVVQESNGGAHCCYRWHIYALSPEFREIFDSARYPIGDGMDDAELLDLNRDGVTEFIHSSNKFSYFDGLCFVCSPRPVVVFEYDEARGRYCPANHRFRSFALRDIKEERRKVAEMNRLGEYDGTYFPTVLDIVVSYIYAGQERRAWLYYRRSYKLADKGRMSRLMRQELQRDRIYRYVYSARL